MLHGSVITIGGYEAMGHVLLQNYTISSHASGEEKNDSF